MENNKRNNKIEDILGSLDGVQRASVPDFFYTRLKARMEKGLEPQRQPSRFLRPAYIIAGLLLILAINTAAVLKNSGSSNETAMADDTESIQQSIAAEYSITDNNAIYTDLNQDR